MQIPKLALNLICIVIKCVTCCSASVNLNRDDIQEASLHRKRGHEMENSFDKRIRVETSPSGCILDGVTKSDIQEYDQGVTVSPHRVNLPNPLGDEDIVLDDSIRSTALEIGKSQFMAIERIPVDTWRQITSYLNYKVNLHHVNRFLFNIVTDYPINDIFQKGLSYHLSLKRPCLSQIQGFQISFGILEADHLRRMPNYIWYSLINKVSHVPQRYWTHLIGTRIRNINLLTVLDLVCLVQ